MLLRLPASTRHRGSEEPRGVPAGFVFLLPCPVRIQSRNSAKSDHDVALELDPLRMLSHKHPDNAVGESSSRFNITRQCGREYTLTDAAHPLNTHQCSGAGYYHWPLQVCKDLFPKNL